MRKIVFIASTLTSTAVAFGLGALTFSSHSTPADAAAQPQPTQTVTAPATAPDKATEGTSTDTKPTQAKATTKDAAKTTTNAGSKGPFKDAQGDGRVLDDIGKTFLPNGVGVHVPDALLPFPGRGDNNTTTTDSGLPPGVVPAQPEGTYTDPDAGTDTSDDVVSGAPGESTSDATTQSLPLDAPRPAPGGVRTAPVGMVLPADTTASGVLPVGVSPVVNSGSGVVPSGVLPVGVVVAN